MSNTKELLKQRFDELRAQRETILLVSQPKREQRDKIKNEALEECRKIDEEIKIYEKDLLQIDNELSMLTKAAGGRRLSDGRS